MNKTKKITSLVLAVMMVVSMLVVGTVAASASTASDLQSALNAGGNVTLTGNITTSEAFRVPEGKTVVLDLAGYTLYSTNTSEKNAICNNGGTLTIKDSVGTGAIIAQECCVVTYCGGTTTIESGTFTALDNSVFSGNGTSGNGGCTWNINGGTFNGGIQSAGYSACGIYAPNDDTWNVNGGTFNITDGAAIVQRAGTVNVNGGTFNVTGTGKGKVGDSRQVIPNGTAVVYDSKSGYPRQTDNANLNVSGGTFDTTTQAAAFVNESNDKNDRIDITGGTFKQEPATQFVPAGVTVENNGNGFVATVTSTYSVGDTGYDDFAEARNAVADGGTIKVLKDATFPANTMYGIKKDVTLDLLGNTLSGTYTLFSVQEGGNLTITNGEVACSGDYAVQSLTTGTVTITDTATVKSDTERAVEVYGGTLVVNGKAESAGMQAIQCNYYQTPATVTVNGTVEGVHGIGIYGDADGHYAANVVVNGTVTASGFAIYSNGKYNYDYDITVNTGATVKSTDGMGIYHCNNGTLTIKGGNVTGTTGVQAKSGKTVVSGGYIYGTGAANAYVHNNNGSSDTGDALLVENCNYPGGSPSIEIKGGTFNSANGQAVASYAQNENYPEVNNFISGGTFSSDVSELAVSGKEAAANAYGRYKIVTATNPLTANQMVIEAYQNKTDKSSVSTSDDGNNINTKGVRIITKFDKTTIGATEYGYIVGKYSGNKTVDQMDFTRLNTNNGAKKIDCTDSTNTITGLGEDYVTLAVNGMAAGEKVVARFYAVVNGETYYSDYISAFGNANGGILAVMA